MRTTALALLSALALAAAPAFADGVVQFARSPDVSADGKLVAFSYHGDIWVASAEGGVARPVTMHQAHELWPVFSPDRQQIAFSSNRHGNYDVFVVSVLGGKPRRLTFDSADDYVTDWSPDGKSLLISSGRSTQLPFNFGLYRTPVDGGREERIGVNEGREGVWSPSGSDIAYVRGPGTWYRKGYRGSSNDDIWLCNADGSNHRRISSFDCQDNAPMWSADGRKLFYVTEGIGTAANIVCQEIGSKDPPTQITHHKSENVRRARISSPAAPLGGEGKGVRGDQWIIYECGADLWMLSTRTGASRKLTIEAYADDKTNPERFETYDANASEFAVSADEKYIALVIRGEVFVMQRSGGNATLVTKHPAYDHGLTWAPDSRSLVFLSDRNGYEDIYMVEPEDATLLASATRFKVKALTNTPVAEQAPQFAPNGKSIAYLSGGKLYTMNPDGSGVKTIIDQPEVVDFEWSPDSKWFCCTRQDHSFASELYIVPASGATASDPLRNVTRYATLNAGPSWSRFGQRVAFISQREPNTTAAHVLALQKPAAADAESSSTLDWEDMHQRVNQPVRIPAYEVAISRDGTHIAFRGKDQDNLDLYVADIKGEKVARLTTGGVRPNQIRWSGLLSSLIYYRDGKGALHIASVGTPSTTLQIPFKARMAIDRNQEYAEMFEQSWRALNDSFYDPGFHGADWKAIRERYRPLVKHCVLKEDLYALINLMLGELNSSHLGISGLITTPEQQTADLGLLFDPEHRGAGLKVSEILRRGPADLRGLDLKPGDVILEIEGTPLDDKANLSQLLNDTQGQTVRLQVARNSEDPKARRKITLEPVSRARINALMYDRWVEKNAQRVSELSQGKLGYIHIENMQQSGLMRFIRALYSDNFDKEGIVLDVRYNGGGYTHEQVMSYLLGKEHTLFRPRNGGEGLVLNFNDRKWTKPLVLLINNRSYSDAEIFPHAFRTMGLGKLVGQPTAGHVIGMRVITLVDGSSFRVPHISVLTSKGVNLEREGVDPDVLVEEHPDQLARGLDVQLEKAVDVLRQDVVTRKTNGAAGIARTPANAPAGTSEQPMSRKE